MKKTRIVAIGLLVLFAGLFVLKGLLPSGGNGGKAKPNDQPKVEAVKAPEFSADSAYAYVAKQVAFGPRVPNSKAHKECGDWLVSKFKSFGADVLEQTGTVKAYDGTQLPLRNIIAQINPEAKKRIMLAAHWDTRPFADKDSVESRWKKPIDGANDGASGVAVLLELARMFQATPLQGIGVDLVLWDVEDYGQPEFDKTENDQSYLTWCLGSQYWADHKHKDGYQAQFGILLDMVGAKDARFNKEGVSMQVGADIVNSLWKIGQQQGYGGYFQDQTTGEIVDDHLFMNQAGVRTIDIIDMRPSTKAMGFGGYEFGSFHHTHNDNLENIDSATLKAVGQTVAQLLYNVH
jgi:hypothetical protein